MSKRFLMLARTLKRINHQHLCGCNEGLAPLDLTLIQWIALLEIESNAGASLHALAERTFNSDQAMGTLVFRLLERGLVSKKPAAGRAAVHELTAKGERLLDEGRKVVDQTLKKTFGTLSNKKLIELEEILLQCAET